MPESQKAKSQMSGAETYLRAICKEKGVPFTPAMQQVVATMGTPRDEDEIPSLDQQFAQFGGLDEFLKTYCKITPKVTMSISSIKKPSSFQAADAMREAALVRKLEITKAELRKEEAAATEAKAELATVRAKLEATKRPKKPISRIAK